ncbi:MAG TPA: cytochrome c biogenesis protein CcsA [Bacteroidota bacterium]|nr:cytochrome c biogenesis protein CcsA [Bacteroidota bacterium]
MVEQLLIWIAFVTSMGAGFLYYTSARRQNTSSHSMKSRLADRSFLVMLIAGVSASVFLFYYFLTHQFQFSYVYRYSSRDLPLLYLISAFWAGQEGTFLLWAVLVGLMGMFFRRSVRTGSGYSMAVVSAFSGFLYLLMLVKSPFEITPEIPPDGAGLNPLLQDPWMAIHPPILFVGYAASIFPFALVIAGMVRREYSQWLNFGLRWTIVAALWLGAGIIIGGFWAYEVLGWGGYWGWDPVENSSLVPWITLLALIHGLIIQKAKGSLVKTNIFLAIITFTLVLFATFLTRSGVLGDFSVHSFVDLGINNYLIAAIVVTLVIGFGLFINRFREMRGPAIELSSWTREFVLAISIMVLCASGLFIIVGTSSPLLTGLFGAASQVDISFYNKVNLPIAILMGILLGITPYLSWIPQGSKEIMKQILPPLILSAVVSVMAYVVGVRSMSLLVFVTTAAFALWTNLFALVRNWRVSFLNTGAPLAHVGVALMFIGIVGSGNYGKEKTLMLKQDEPQNAFGYDFTFKGVTTNPNAKNQMNIEVSDGKSSFIATPKLYFSKSNQGMMREPDIKILPLEDLYISPQELKSTGAEHQHPIMEITKGETKEIEGYKITFVRFETGQHAESGAMAVGAVLNVASQGKDHEVAPAIMINEQGDHKDMPATLPSLDMKAGGEKNHRVTINGMSVEQKKILLEFHGFDDHTSSAGVESLILQVSTKPLMLVVWAGVVLIVIGTFVAFNRRMIVDGVS